MIQRLSHGVVYVADQDRAKAFYTEKLGFEVRSDDKNGGFRWLTVGPAGQADFQLVLMPIVASPLVDDESVHMIRALVEKGVFGVGVLQCDDCRATYEDLRRRGVEFLSEPTERSYGLEAVFRDDSGNFFTLCQSR
ncbi:MAG: VOC family protein [Polyangiaceae bacterium]|nr:VOC family protein [Polyangiaceae bacterium]